MLRFEICKTYGRGEDEEDEEEEKEEGEGDSRVPWMQRVASRTRLL